jgi:hypothetical protein
VIVGYKLEVRFDKNAAWIKVRSKEFADLMVGDDIPIHRYEEI